MLVSLATIAITALLVATVVLSWVGDLRRAGRATSAREATETLSSHDQRIRQMQARIRAERLRRERVHGPTPPPPGPAAAPPPPDDARHRAVLELGTGPVTPDLLRRQYRALVAGYHPDRVAGLGRKLQVLADEETKAINAAYSYFKRRLRDD